MVMAKVTYKGQVTIPKTVRQQLGIEDGDSVLFQFEEGKVIMKRVKRADVSDLCGVFRTNRPFPGKEAVRAEVRRYVAERVARIPT